MVAIFYHGVWRMDWGLGNPNKTAALISLALIGIWILPFLSGRLFYFSVALFAVLGVCLVHTFSRGGIVAASVGLAVLLFYAPRAWRRHHVLGIAISLLLIALAALYFHAFQRYLRPPGKDLSVVHRFEIWRRAPAMMIDAPAGWGLGRSGLSYQRWYQPLDRTDYYRTLISSHFTWLVELGWVMGCLYIFGWLLVLMCCLPPPSDVLRWFSVPLALWATFAVAAAFSSVAESIWLWILPAGGLAAVIVARVAHHDWPPRRNWYVVLMGTAIMVAGLGVAGSASSDHFIAGSSDAVVLGPFPPKWWVLVNPATVGDHYERKLRYFLARHRDQGAGIGTSTSIDSIPREFDGTIVLIGDIADMEKLRDLPRSKVMLISPKATPKDVESYGRPISKVYLGEFSQSQVASEWRQTKWAQSMEGVTDFVQNWPEVIFGAAHESTSSEAARGATTNDPTLIAGTPASAHPETIDLAKFRERVEARDSLVFDARPEIFHRLGHVPGALSLPREDFQSAYEKLRNRMEPKKDGRILVYCSDSGCEDSEMVASALIKLGYSNVSVFKGGWGEWTQAHLPEERSP